VLNWNCELTHLLSLPNDELTLTQPKRLKESQEHLLELKHVLIHIILICAYFAFKSLSNHSIAENFHLLILLLVHVFQLLEVTRVSFKKFEKQEVRPDASLNIAG